MKNYNNVSSKTGPRLDEATSRSIQKFYLQLSEEMDSDSALETANISKAMFAYWMTFDWTFKTTVFQIRNNPTDEPIDLESTPYSGYRAQAPKEKLYPPADITIDVSQVLGRRDVIFTSGEASDKGAPIKIVSGLHVKTVSELPVTDSLVFASPTPANKHTGRVVAQKRGKTEESPEFPSEGHGGRSKRRSEEKPVRATARPAFEKAPHTKLHEKPSIAERKIEVSPDPLPTERPLEKVVLAGTPPRVSCRRTYRKHSRKIGKSRNIARITETYRSTHRKHCRKSVSKRNTFRIAETRKRTPRTPCGKSVNSGNSPTRIACSKIRTKISNAECEDNRRSIVASCTYE